MARASPFRNFSLAIPTESIPRSRKINQVTPHIYAEGILGMNGITIKDPYTKRCMMPYTNHLNIGFTFALRCQLAPPKKRGLHKPQLEKVVKTNYILYSCVKRHYLICLKKTISFKFCVKSVWICLVYSKSFVVSKLLGVTFIGSEDVKRFLAQMTFGAKGFSG